MAAPALMDPLLDVVERLVAVPSVSSDAAACARVMDLVDALVPQEGLHRTRGSHHLVISTSSRREAALVLNAHLDVVPARPGQFAVRREGARISGRGVYDMKGAAAVYVEILREVARLTDKPDLQVQFVTDEEIGGHCGAGTLVQEGFSGDFFVAGEPTNLDVCNRAKGVLWLTVRLPGRPGHAAMPWQAQNPIPVLSAGLARVLECYPLAEDEVWRTTATPTVLRAGEAHNRVPEEAHLGIDVRWVAEDDPEAILDFVRRCFPGAAVEIVQLAPALDTPPDHPAVQRLAAIQEDRLGRAPSFVGAHFASDARYWGARGVPAVCWGPSGGGMHADHEWLDLDGLRAYHELVRALVGIR